MRASHAINQSETRAAYGRGRERAKSISNGLGWFSIGLGLTELLAPHLITRYLGMQGRETLVRMYGLREIAAGAGLLSAENKAPWLWGRVGGDALDLATLGLGMNEDNPKRDNVILAAVMVGGVTALDYYCAQRTEGLNALEHAPDYSARTGFPRGTEDARGVAKDQASAMRPSFVDNPPRYEKQKLAAAT